MVDAHRYPHAALDVAPAARMGRSLALLMPTCIRAPAPVWGRVPQTPSFLLMEIGLTTPLQGGPRGRPPLAGEFEGLEASHWPKARRVASRRKRTLTVTAGITVRLERWQR